MGTHPSGVNLVSLLRAARVPTSELRHALLVHFGSSELAPDENTGYFVRVTDNPTDAFSIKLNFRDAMVADIEAGLEASRQDLASIGCSRFHHG